MINRLDILIVEDDIIIHMHVKKTLRSLGFRNIYTAKSSKEALSLASKTKIDILVANVKINGHIDGIDTAHTLQSLYGLPVILITAYKDREMIRRASKIDTVGYLVKPYKITELEKLIHQAVEKYELNLNENLLIIDDDHRYDKSEKKLYFKKEEIALTKKEKLFVSVLLENLNNHVPYEILENRVWNNESVTETTKRTFYSRARLKFPYLTLKTQRSSGIGVFTA